MQILQYLYIMKKTIVLNENDIRRIVEDAVISICNEELVNEGKWGNRLGTAATIAGMIGAINAGGRMNAPKIENNGAEDTDKVESVAQNRMDINYYPSQSILDKIKEFEGWHGGFDKNGNPKPGWQNDGKGNPTTGWGFKIDNILKKEYPQGMTMQQADNYFINTAIPERVQQFRKSVPNINKYNQNQLDALFDLFYNIGITKFTAGSPNLQNALANMDYETAIAEMDHDYNNDDVPGARKRRDYERQLFAR